MQTDGEQHRTAQHRAIDTFSVLVHNSKVVQKELLCFANKNDCPRLRCACFTPDILDIVSDVHTNILLSAVSIVYSDCGYEFEHVCVFTHIMHGFIPCSADAPKMQPRKGRCVQTF
jgi:hypothetical protein